MPTPYKIAFQLYTSRNFPPLEDQLEGLAELGYDGVEPFLPNYGDDPALFRRQIDAAGLACFGFHLPDVRDRSIPTPVSDTVRIRPPDPLLPSSTVMQPLSVNFSALPIRLVAILRKASMSPTTPWRVSGAIVTCNASRFSSTSGAIRRDDVLQHAGGVKRRFLEGPGAGLDPRDIKQPVHQAQLAVCRGKQEVEEIPCLRVLLAQLEQLRDANDTVQRRSKLMADVAQELAFRQIRCPGQLQRLFEAPRRAQ